MKDPTPPPHPATRARHRVATIVATAALFAGCDPADTGATTTTSPSECVISLREAPPNPDDHFSRRVTTPHDCIAHPPGSTYHTGDGS